MRRALSDQCRPMPFGFVGQCEINSIETVRKELGTLPHVLLGFFGNMIGRLFNAGHLVAGILRREHQFIELELKRQSGATLRGLNERHD
jgi:hypothetical protein